MSTSVTNPIATQPKPNGQPAAALPKPDGDFYQVIDCLSETERDFLKRRTHVHADQGGADH